MQRLLCFLLGHRWQRTAVTGDVRPQGGTYQNRFHDVCRRCLAERCLEVYLAEDALGRPVTDVPPDELRYVLREERP